MDFRCRQVLVFGLCLFCLAASAHGIEIDGVGNGAIDQPRVNMRIIDPLTDSALDADVSGLAGLFDGLGLGDVFGFSDTNIEAFYDTGAGIASLIGGKTAQDYDVDKQPGASFSDVGVGGLETFDVSEAYRFSIASFTPGFNPSDLSSYNHTFENVYAAVGDVPNAGDFLGPTDQAINDVLAGLFDFNVLGMHFFDQKTVVFDARALNNFVAPPGGGESNDLLADGFPALYTHVYSDGDPTVPAFDKTNLNNPGIPDASEIDLTIELEFADFSALTSSSGGTPPTLAHNPMIGGGLPSHLNETVDTRDSSPGVNITMGAKQATNKSFLFDTGGATSFLSLEIARNELGMRYATAAEIAAEGYAGPALVYVNDSDEITGVVEDQFSLQVQGVGGTINVIGTKIDEITITAYQDYDGAKTPVELTFLNAPMLIGDISIDDPLSPGGVFTLDGVFGMNFLLATANLDGAVGIFDLAGLELIPGAFDFIVYEETDNLLHLSFDQNIIPEPTSLALVLFGLLGLTRRRA